jgi:drug/metabolite transporter (DMT)-like permease
MEKSLDTYVKDSLTIDNDSCTQTSQSKDSSTPRHPEIHDYSSNITSELSSVHDPEPLSVRLSKDENIESGLFGREGLAKAPNVMSIVIKIVVILCGYAFAMFSNGAASRLIPPRFLLPPDSSATSALSLVNRMVDKGFLMTSFRFFAVVFCLVPILVITKNTPPKGIFDFPSDPNKLLIPVFIGISNAGGYLPYMLLCSSTGVALWSSLTALYVIGPVSYGIFVKNESRGRMKLAGILMCVIAAILLALPKGVRLSDRDSSGGGNESTVSSEFSSVFTLFLFMSSILIWGACDSLSAYVGRDMHMFHVLVFTGIGFGILALFCSILSFMLVAGSGGGSIYTPEGAASQFKNTSSTERSASVESSSFGGVTSVAAGYVVFFLAQLSGTLGWYFSVKLGQESEASAFLPVTCLYTTLTALMSVVFLGEQLALEAWFGIILASLGMLAISKNNA